MMGGHAPDVTGGGRDGERLISLTAVLEPFSRERYELAIGKSLGRRGTGLLVGACESDEFDGLYLIVIPLPVRKVELKRDGIFRGLLDSFSLR